MQTPNSMSIELVATPERSGLAIDTLSSLVCQLQVTDHLERSTVNEPDKVQEEEQEERINESVTSAKIGKAHGLSSHPEASALLVVPKEIVVESVAPKGAFNGL